MVTRWARRSRATRSTVLASRSSSASRPISGATGCERKGSVRSAAQTIRQAGTGSRPAGAAPPPPPAPLLPPPGAGGAGPGRRGGAGPGAGGAAPPRLLALHRPRREAACGRPDQDLARRGGLLKACGQVDRLARGKRRFARVDDDLAGLDADARL